MMIPFFEQNCRNDLDDDDDTMILIFVSMIDVAITSWASRKNEPAYEPPYEHMKAGENSLLSMHARKTGFEPATVVSFLS